LPQELTDITQDIDEILEIDVADIDSILGQTEAANIPSIDDEIISDVRIKDILERIESRKDPSFIDQFLQNLGGIINIQKPPIAQIGLKSNIDKAIGEGDIEEVQRLAKIEGSLNQIKDIYSLDQDRGFWAEVGTSFLQNILPDWVDNSGDERTVRLQEEINAILQSEGMEPVEFDNQLTMTQNLGKAIGNTAAVLPYYFLGGVATAPFRALALSRIVQIANPKHRAALNVIQNIGHTAAAFSAAEVLHSGFDPKNIMINGVLQGSGEAVAEMGIYTVLSKFMGPSAKYPARYLATSTTEFFQELTGQYFSTGKLPDLETVSITAIVSGLFGVAARRGMEVDILNVYNNAVKDRQRLLDKRKGDPDSFTEEDLNALNMANNLAETIKNNAKNWRLRDAFSSFTEDRKNKRGESFQKARTKLEELSGVAGAIATEVDIEELTESPTNLVNYLKDRGFSEEEILNTPPEEILAELSQLSDVDNQLLTENYRDIYQGIDDLREELGDPSQLLTEEELFGKGKTERELGITETELPLTQITEKEILPTKEEVLPPEKAPEITEITEAELPKPEKPLVEKPKEEVATAKLGEDLITERGQATRKAIEKGLKMTDKEVQEFRSEIERGYKQFFKDIESGVDPQSLATEQLRLQTLREALSAKIGKFVEYDETGFKESPIEKSYLSKIIADIKAGKVEPTSRPKPTLDEQNKRLGLIKELGYANVGHAINSVNKRRRKRGLEGTYNNIQEIPEKELRDAAETSESITELKATRRAQGVVEKEKGKPTKVLSMNFDFGKGQALRKGEGVESDNTFDAIIEGKRTATSRRDRSLENVEVGDRLQFTKTGRPEPIEVEVITKRKAGEITPEEWAKLEGYNISDAISNWTRGKNLSTYTQIEYKVISKEKPETVVHAGRGQNVILSNFAETPFVFSNVKFKTAEGAYQAWKSGILKPGYENLSGTQAKSKGRGQKVDRNTNLALMREILQAKYDQVPEFKKALDSAGKITHPVSDKFWSENFPKLLEELKGTVPSKSKVEKKVAKPKRAKLPSGEIVDIIETPTTEDIGVELPSRSDIDNTISVKDLPTEANNPVDIPQPDFTQSELTSNNIPTPNIADVDQTTDNAAVDNIQETDGRDEQNVEENTQAPEENGIIVTRIVNEEDVKDVFTLSGWLVARGIAILPADIDLAAINSKQDFTKFVKTLSDIIGKDKFVKLHAKKSTFRRAWFKSKDKIVKNNFIYEPGKGITINTTRAPDQNFINRIDNASPMDTMVGEYNNQNPNDKIDLYYFSGWYKKDHSKRTGKSYYTTENNARQPVSKKQHIFGKSRLIFYSTASDGKKEVWIQASENIWKKFADNDTATKFYNDRKSKYKLPDLDKKDNTQFLATRLYYFEKMNGILKTGLTDANFTKRAQIYMAAGGNLSGMSFNAEFKEEDSFYNFDPETHDITRGEKGEKEGHDGAIYVTLDKMKEIVGYTGNPDHRIVKPFLYAHDKSGRPIGLKCACFVASPKMEAEMKKSGIDTRIYLSSEKMGQIKGGEKLKLDGKDMVINALEVREHSESTFTRAIFPTLPIDHNNLRPADVFNDFVKKRIDQFTKLVGDLLRNADDANRFLRKIVKYTGDSKYENVGRMLEMGFSWHPEIISATKDIFKNKHINENLMKFRRKGSTAYLMPDDAGNLKVGEVLLPEYFSTSMGLKPGDKVVVNRSPSARVDNFRVLTVRGFNSASRYGNAITMNGGETIFYQESDYDIDKVHIIVDMTPEEIKVIQSLSKAIGVVPVEKSKKVDNIWDVNDQWAVQRRFAVGKTAIGEITNIQTVYSMLVQNNKAIEVSPKGEVTVVDLDFAIKNGGGNKFYLIPKFQDIIEMQKFIAPIHQASVDNAKLDALSTIMDGQPYSRELLIEELFSVSKVSWVVERTLPEGFDPVSIGFNSNKSPVKQMLNVMKTFTKDWDDGGSSWSYDDQHNTIMAYKNASQNRTNEFGETLFPNSPLHNFFNDYPRASLINGGYFGERGKFIFRDNLRMHHYETMESVFRKDINRLDPYQGGKVSPERNEEMTNAIIEIFKLKDQHYLGNIPTKTRVEVTPNRTLNEVEGFHEKIDKTIKDLNLNSDERLWFDLKMLNNFDGIQSHGKFKGNLSPEQLKQVLLRDYNTRNEFLTKGDGKNYKQLNLSAYVYPISKESAFKSRYEPYFISRAISKETLKKYANTYNNFYNQNIKKKQEVSSGFLAESKGSLGVGIDPSRIMDTFGGALKAANKYLSPKGEASWWKWFNEDKHAEILNRQVAKVNELLDRVYGTEVWGEKTVTDFIVHTLTEGTGSRPATRARLDFDKVPITIEEGNILIHELESLYRQLNTSQPSKFMQSVLLTKELLSKHPITKGFYDKLSNHFRDVNKYAAELLIDIDTIEKGSLGIVEPINIPGFAIKSPISRKVTRRRINKYHKLFKKFMELKVKQDIKGGFDEEISQAKKGYESYLQKNPDIKDRLDLMKGIATVHQEVDEVAIIASTLMKNNPTIRSKLVSDGIIRDNFDTDRQYFNRVLKYFNDQGIKYSTDIHSSVYNIAKRTEIRKRRDEYEKRSGNKVKIPDEQLFITIDRMDKAAKAIYDFDKKTFDTYITPRKEEIKLQIAQSLVGVTDVKGNVVNEVRANKVAEQLVSFIPDDFRRIERYFPWVNLSFQVERHYSVWNLDALIDDIKKGDLNLDEWLNKPAITGFFKPRRDDWKSALKDDAANIPWDIPEVLRVRMLASMNVRKVSSVRSEFAELFRKIRTGILEGKLTPREESFFTGIERYLNILKYDLQSIPWARKALNAGTFNGSFDNKDYLDSSEISESQRSWYTNADLISKIYRNMRTFSFLGLEMPVSIRNVASQGIVVAGSDLGHKRIMSAVGGLMLPGGIKSSGAIVPEKVNGEFVTNEKIMKDLALDHDDIIAQVEESQLPTQFTVAKDIDKSRYKKLGDKVYKLSGHMANWGLETINVGPFFAKSFFWMPLSFRDSEIYLNRLGTAKAAIQKVWEDFDKRGVSITPEEKYAKALDFARKKVDEIHFDYGLLNRPQMMRHKMGAALFVFRSFTWNQANMFYHWARDFGEVRSFENLRRLLWFGGLQALGLMATTYTGIEMIRFFDWALGDVFRDLWSYIKWLVDDDEEALNSIGYGTTEKIKNALPNIPDAAAVAIAATNHVFTGVVPDMVNLFMYSVSDEEFRAPWDLSKRNRFLLSLYQAGGLKQAIKLQKFHKNWEKTWRAMTKGIDPKYPEETMKPGSFAQWYLTRQLLGTYIPPVEYNKRLKPPAGVGIPNLNFTPKLK
jgi:hypothetical protein